MIIALAAAVALAPPATLRNASELPARFNLARGDARLVLILTPTNSSSLVGARIIRRDVLNNLISEPFRAFVIWTPMKADDTWDAAQKASSRLDSLDVDQFWDPTRSVARQYGQVLELPSHRSLAWNVYVVHSRADEWSGSRPPIPAAWMHQLGSDERTLDGPTLLNFVTKEIKRPRPPARGQA